jgi:hypothetical protein
MNSFYNTYSLSRDTGSGEYTLTLRLPTATTVVGLAPAAAKAIVLSDTSTVSVNTTNGGGIATTTGNYRQLLKNLQDTDKKDLSDLIEYSVSQALIEDEKRSI